MDFKGFYDEIIFDVDRSILKSYTGKQGDTKSRGLYVTVTQKNAAIEDLTGLSMRLFYEKPDKTRGFIDGVVDGNKFRIDYTNQMYAVPGVVKAELRLMGSNEEIITAKTFKILVDSSIADGSIISENERGILDRAFELAEDIIPRLELLDVELLEDVQDEMLGARHSNTKDETYDSLGQRLDVAEQDLLDHKAEHTSNRQQDQLKIAKVEKELNDYQSTLAQVNINQEATQTATGYGMVSLPKNAANGQVSVTVKGNTETDEEGNTKSTISAVRIKSVGKNLCPVNNVSNVDWSNNSVKAILKDHIFYIDSGSYVFTAEKDRNCIIRCYVFDDIDTLLSCKRGNDAVLKSRERIELALDASMSKRFLSEGYALFGVFSYDASTVNATNIQLERGETATPYEPYTESSAYVIATDPETGGILEARSVPSGAKDEFNVVEGEYTKKVIDTVSVSGTIFASLDTTTYVNVDVVKTTAFSDAMAGTTSKDGMTHLYDKNGVELTEVAQTDIDNPASVGKYYWHTDKTLWLIVAKGAYADISAARTALGTMTLIYQLAEPVEIPIQVSGSIASYPSGTIYIERILPDAGVYTDKITILHQDAPIKRLDRLSKVDFYTGVETELDVSEAVIAEDKLSFTHPELNAGDIVFFEYEYDVESTDGEAEVEFYDSRYVVKDTETGKFYKWNIVVANGQPSIELVEV